jgi:hypothetical protein
MQFSITVTEGQNVVRGYGEGQLFLTTIHSMLLFSHARKYFRVRVFEDEPYGE